MLLISAPAVLMFASLAYGQAPQDKQPQIQISPRPTKQAASSKASAYYHYSLGHLYEELAGSTGNRSDYVNKSIENYRLAMKEDPSASFLVEEIAELYRVSGRIREAVEEAQEALKTNPDDLNARRVLARIYTQQIGDAQTNHIDESMARRAARTVQADYPERPKGCGESGNVGPARKAPERFGRCRGGIQEGSGG